MSAAWQLGGGRQDGGLQPPLTGAMASVRSARLDALSAVLELYRQLNPDDPALESDLARRRSEKMLAVDSLDVLVVAHDDRLVASCVISVTPKLTRNARPFAVIVNVDTHADYRECGFGSRVIDAALDRAADRDCYKVMLLTGTDADWKLAFYEHCGFDRDDKTGLVRYL